MRTNVLITVKTYPTISVKYDELVCTAGFREDGSWTMRSATGVLLRDDHHLAAWGSGVSTESSACCRSNAWRA
jgi:hypothetical protein